MARYELRLPECSSLKDKRSVMRTLTHALHASFHCAVAEVDHQDEHRRAALGVSVVSGTHFQAQKVLHTIERRVESHPGVELLSAAVDVISEHDR
ncbi:MAG TPA: DUF503 domain-containing protein [Actinomycetota bacterium]